MNKEKLQSVLGNKTAANLIAVFGSFALLFALVAIYNFSGADYFLARLSSFKSENVQVQPYAPVVAQIGIVIQPSGSGCVTDPLVIQPTVAVKDQYGKNMPDGTLIEAMVAGGTGRLTGAVSAKTVNGVASFRDLGYSIPEQVFSIVFKAGGYSVNSDAITSLQDCNKSL